MCSWVGDGVIEDARNPLLKGFSHAAIEVPDRDDNRRERSIMHI